LPKVVVLAVPAGQSNLRPLDLMLPHHREWIKVGWYGMVWQNLSHDHAIYKRQNERLGNVPFCI